MRLTTFINDNCSDIVIDDESTALSHHGILGMKWGQRNGPPYPLGNGDHSARETKAAKKAGIKVGSNSKKGSLDASSPNRSSTKGQGQANQPPKIFAGRKRPQPQQQPPRQETPEEHEARRQAALNSGDYNRIRSVANESTTNELNNAMLRAQTMQRLNSEIARQQPPKKSAADKIDDVMNNINRAGRWYDTATGAWNRFARQYNAVNQTGADLFVFGQDTSTLRSAADKAKAQQDKVVKKTMETAARRGDYKTLQKYWSVAPSEVQNNVNNILQNRSRFNDNMNKYRNSTGNDMLDKALRQVGQTGDYSALNEPMRNASASELKAGNDYLKAYASMSQYVKGNDADMAKVPEVKVDDDD